MHIEEKKVAILTEPKTTHFDLTNFFGNNLQHAIDSVIKYNEFLAEHTVKIRLANNCPNINIETILINTENSKTN